MLVVDASFAVEASLADALGRLAGHRAVAPVIFWSETNSVLHELAWRRTISAELAATARAALARAPIDRRMPDSLWSEAWAIADRLGLAKTYDAEYIALARQLHCPLLTLDGRLARAARREIEVFTPADL